jgi:hypothetical protein
VKRAFLAQKFGVITQAADHPRSALREMEKEPHILLGYTHKERLQVGVRNRAEAQDSRA